MVVASTELKTDTLLMMGQEKVSILEINVFICLHVCFCNSF